MGRGNKKEQNRRKRERYKRLPKRQPYAFDSIDGNPTYYPVGYCKYKKSWLSIGQYECHRCYECMHYEDGINI